MTDRPPLTPADCDLQDFQYMELDVRRLRDSKFSSTPNAEAFRAGVMLWCAAWHQVPAASLPDDDVELADLAGYGKMPFSVKYWRKVRTEALAGFIKCADGRLYHEVIAEKANTAWASRLEYSYEKLKDRTRKENKHRAETGLPAIVVPPFSEWISAGRPKEIPPPKPTIPAENALKGNGEGEGEVIPSEANASGADAPPPAPSPSPTPAPSPSPTPAPSPTPSPPSLQDQVYAIGIVLLTSADVTDKNARSFLAMQCKTHGAERVVEALNACAAEKPVQPVPWLVECLKSGPQRQRQQMSQHSRLSGAGRALFRDQQPEVFDAEPN